MRRLLAFLLLALAVAQLAVAGYIPAKAWLAQCLLQAAWDRVLAGEADARPWAWADTRPLARLEVPRLGVERLVLAGASGRSLAFGPGWLDGSAPPGDDGNTVIAGHRDTHFEFLRRLRVGDDVWLQAADGARHRYRVAEARVVDARRVRLPAKGPSRLTLVTCYPFDAVAPGGSERYLVTAEAVTGG